MRRSFYSIVLIISAILPQIAAAVDDPGINFRERCRRVISGTFATVIADKSMADDQVTLAETYLKKSKIKIESGEVKMRLIKQKLAASDYSPDLLTERDVVASQIKLYHEQFLTSENQLAEAKKRQASAAKRDMTIRKKVESIFKVTMSEDPDGGPRPIFNKIEWKTDCPKYRSLCPLPEKESLILVSLLDDIDDTDNACHRYSKIK